MVILESKLRGDGVMYLQPETSIEDEDTIDSARIIREL